MIRPFTFVCMLLAGMAGLYLYHTKHQSQMLDREIAHTMKLAEAARARAGVLQAEYALLNDPSRLEQLAGEHLPALKTTAPNQFATWAEFEKHLPPVGAPAVEAPPLEPEAPAATLPEAAPEAKPDAKPEAKPEVKPEPARSLVAARPAARPATTAVSLAEPPSPAAPVHPAARPAATPVSLTEPPAPVHPAASPPQPVAVSAPVAPPTPPQPRTMPTYTPPGAAPVVGSALGMARTMTAASPVSPATAALWQPGGNER
jgi:hypothetical protein